MSEVSDCVFCGVFETSYSGFDVDQPIGDDRTTLKPALGMLMPGYLLAISNEHLTSFAQYTPDQLRVLHTKLERFEKYLGDIFAKYIRVEHGSDNISDCGSGGCIDHAHIHLIPDEEVGELARNELDWQQLTSYEELSEFRGTPYIYLGYDGSHYIMENPSLPGQWIRRKIGQIRSIDHWDYAVYSGAKELLETHWRLRSFPQGRFIFNLEKDSAQIDARKPRIPGIDWIDPDVIRF